LVTPNKYLTTFGFIINEQILFTMYKTKLFLSLLLVAAFNFNGATQVNIPNEDAQQKLNTVDKQFFIENKGQWNADVLYLTRIGGLDAWITKKGVNYTFYQLEEIKQEESTNHELEMPDKFEHKDYNIIGHRVLMNLIGSNPKASPEGKQKQTAYYNYFIGNDDSKHASNVGLYKEALVKEVYTGIDIRYYFDRGSLRYDYIVHPRADPNQIRFSIEGSDKTYLNEKGELVFTTRFGEVKNADLYCYQQQDKKQVAAKFTKHGESWTITLDAYNKNQTLIIDPLIYSTYIGGNADDYSWSIALDTMNNAYITGFTLSINYDTTSGAFQTTYGGGSWDVFVSKLNTTGSTLIYSTFIGGTYNEQGFSIALDSSENAYITGRSGSIDYPITSGAYQTNNAGNDDAFVTKLNSMGNGLIYSTYLGGGSNEIARSIILDSLNNAYISGQTFSTNYPITAGAYQTNNGGSNDIFVTKLNSNGTSLIYSTYLGGNQGEDCFAITLDTSNNAYITGATYSSDFDVTLGAYQTVFGGGTDVIVAKLNASGSALIYSTFIGGGINEWGSSIALDASNNAYITGSTNSFDYDITLGAYQTTFAGGSDVFVTKLNATGSALIYSTYIGGGNSEISYAIVLDNSNNAYITGFTNSINYDITSGAFQTTLAGLYDVFVTKINSMGNGIIYSTYLGGSNQEIGYGIGLDNLNNAYITGFTKSLNYDITVGAFQTVYNGGYNDNFVTKIGLYPCIQTTGTDVIIACDSLVWSNGNTYFTSTNTPALIFSNSVGCDSVVTLNLTIKNSTSSTDIITACDSITWIDGIAYTASTNTPTFVLTNAAGCDSVVTLNLTINANSGTDIVTACDSITWIDGNTYTSSTNTPTYTLTNSVSCDSVVTLNLTINNPTSNTDVITACDSITWIDGNTYTASTNIPTFTLTNTAGCDSVVTLNLTINNPTSNIDGITACDSITWIDGNTYISSNNTATFTLTNVVGCDSVVTLNLTINNATTSTDTQTACDSYVWIDGNTYITNNNTATFTLANSLGCDSVVTLNLTINNATTSTDTQTACDSITWIDGNTYTVSTNTPTFTIFGGAASGCDSIVTLNLTINNPTTSTDTQIACNGYTWLDGNTYTSSNNTATFAFTNAAGCDSVVTLNLTINNATTSNDIQTACDSYTWLDGNTYTSSNNTATFTLINSIGCDSIVTLNLTINPLPTAAYIPQGGQFNLNEVINFTNQSQNATSFHWNFGNNNDTSIIENPSYSYAANGTYTIMLISSAGDCADTISYDFEIIGTSVKPVVVPTAFSPNGDGINDVFSILGGPFKTYQLTVYNEWGQEIFTSNEQIDGWDGSYKGNNQPMGSYVYVFKGVTIADENIKLHGEIAIVK
jgi:gliding motility-associated-like protein